MGFLCEPMQAMFCQWPGGRAMHIKSGRLMIIDPGRLDAIAAGRLLTDFQSLRYSMIPLLREWWEESSSLRAPATSEPETRAAVVEA